MLVTLMFPESPRLPRLRVADVDFPAMKLDGVGELAEMVKSESMFIGTIAVLDRIPLDAVTWME